MANIISELEVLEKYLPAVLALAAGSATESVPLPAESFSFEAGSFGKITVAIPATTITITKA